MNRRLYSSHETLYINISQSRPRALSGRLLRQLRTAYRLRPQAIKDPASNVIVAVPYACYLPAPQLRLIAPVPTCAIIKSSSLVKRLRGCGGDTSNDIGNNRVQI